MNYDYYVYEWIRLDTNEPFYVGKGRGDRWKSMNRGENKHFYNIINFTDVAVNILNDNLTEDEAFDLESYYIWFYRDIIGYDLCNLTDGGEGYSCRGSLNHKSIKVICLNSLQIFESINIAQEKYGNIDIKNCCEGKHNYAGYDNYYGHLSWRYYEEYLLMSSDEIDECIYLANHSRCGERNSFYGKQHTEETIEKLRKASTGKKYSDETKKKLSEMRKGELNVMYGKRGPKNPNYGKPKSPETIKKLQEANGSKVRCIELDIEFLSLNEAEKYMKQYQPKFCRKSLTNYLNGKTKTDYYGEIEINGEIVLLHWEYI